MSAPLARSMTQTDLMSWRMEEDPILRSTIVSIILLDKSPDQDRLLDVMRRAVDIVPMFRCRATPNSFAPSPPRWVADDDFDLSWHIRRVTVPAPGTWEVLLDFARTIGMAAFDRDRPLWELTVLDGLADGGAAIAIKVHHALTDGVGGMRLTREITDASREGELRTAPPQPDSVTEYQGHANADSFSVTRLAALAIGEAADTLRHPIDSVRNSARLVNSIWRFVRPATATLSPVMTSRSTRRRYGVLEFRVAALAAAAAAADCSINDAYLAAVLLGLADYHRQHGVAPSELMVTLPISLRTDDDPLGGNRITLARFALPTDIADPAQLMRSVHAIIDDWRREPAIPLSPHLAGVVNMLPVTVMGNMLKHMDFVASNVVGAPAPLYLAGAKITRQFAFSPTLGSAFNVTLMSYADHACVGINVDAGAVPDLPVLSAAISDGFRAILSLCPSGVDTEVTAVC